jgi:hypothetical protein
MHQFDRRIFFKCPSNTEFKKGISQIFTTTIGSQQYASLWVQGAQSIRAILGEASSYDVQIIRAPREFLYAFGLKEQDVRQSAIPVWIRVACDWSSKATWHSCCFQSCR